MKVRLLIKILILLLMLTSISIPTHAQVSNVSLVEIDLGLVDGTTLMDWYNDQTSFTGHNTYFGAYVTQSIGNDLFIGLGTARPAESTGAYLALFDGSNITGIHELDEQGFHEMLWDGVLLNMAGTDPTDNWETGNHYTHNPNTEIFTKHRDINNGLVNVFHTWGLWEDSGTLYAAVSSHDGTLSQGDACLELDGGGEIIANHCKGQIFSSLNAGETWTNLADLGNYRAYDIIGYNGDLYAIHNDELGGPLSLSKSTTGGTTWNTLSTLNENVRRINMATFDGKLMTTSFDRTSIYTIDSNDNIVTVPIPSDYLLGATYLDTPAYSDYNLMVVVGSYLYLIVENQSTADCAIIRTNDLSNWERIVYTSEKLISLSYWPNTSWLVTSTAGSNARLMRVDLTSTPTSVDLNDFIAFPAIQLSSFESFLGSCAIGIVSIWLLQKIKLRLKTD